MTTVAARFSRKPHLYWDRDHGTWRVTRRHHLADMPESVWHETGALAKPWNTYKGPANRQARLLSAWSKQA